MRILQGDMREKVSELEDASIDAIVTDPPYHLTTKKKGGSGPASVNLDSPYGRARIGTGFMGMKWDGGDIAMRPETWALLLRVAKPGAHLLVFSGSRTFHRIWCAVEDSGWEIRDTLMWLHGEGFPKSSNQHGEWEGWGTALKPAFEPILMARKSLIGTVAENLAAHRTGALNIDACRVRTEDDLSGGAYKENGHRTVSPSLSPTGMNVPGKTAGKEFKQPSGRWPANVMHDGSDEVVGSFPQAPRQQADISYSAPSDKTSNVYGRMRREGEPSYNNENGGAVGFQMRPGARRLDSGSAARFFWSPKASKQDRNEGCEGMQLLEGGMRSETSGAHITRRDGRAPGPVENYHPTVKPTELMQYLCRLVTAPGGVILDPFMGSGSTGKAAVREGMSFVGLELDAQYIEIARRRISGVAPLFEVA